MKRVGQKEGNAQQRSNITYHGSPKIFERIIKDRLEYFAEPRNRTAMHSSASGAGGSIIKALHHIIEAVNCALEPSRKKKCALISFDIKGASIIAGGPTSSESFIKEATHWI